MKIEREEQDNQDIPERFIGIPFASILILENLTRNVDLKLLWQSDFDWKINLSKQDQSFV